MIPVLYKIWSEISRFFSFSHILQQCTVSLQLLKPAIYIPIKQYLKTEIYIDCKCCEVTLYINENVLLPVVFKYLCLSLLRMACAHF